MVADLLLAIAALGSAIAAILSGIAMVMAARSHAKISNVEHATNGMKAQLERLAFERGVAKGTKNEKARHND